MAKPVYAVAQTTINLVRLDSLNLSQKENYYPRVDFGDIKKLAASIKTVGVQQPLLVSKTAEGALQVEHGLRRFHALHALKFAGIDDAVPIVLAARDASTKSILLQVYCGEGKPFLPYEEANIFNRFLSQGLDVETLSEMVGVSLSHIQARLSLVKAVPSVLESLRDGSVSLAAVQRIIEVGGDDIEKQEELLLVELEDKGATQEDVEIKKEEDKTERVRLKLENIKESDNRLPLKKAKAMLSCLVITYAELQQARLPINTSNRYWRDLQRQLVEIRNLKKKGLLSI